MAAVETEDLSRLRLTAVVGPGDRAVVACTGADRVGFLHRILSGTVHGLQPGTGSHSTLLNLKGHVVAEMRVFVRQADVLLVVVAGQAEAVGASLARYAIMDDFAAAPWTDRTLLAVLGPEAAARLASAGVAIGDLAGRPLWSHIEAGDDWIVRVRALGADGFWIGAAPDRLAEMETRLELPRLAAPAAEAARIAAGEPAWGAEITPDYFPMEVGLGAAIDYGKGCYLGQEPIVRIRDRGHLHRRLAGLRFAAGAVPAAKDALETDARPRAGHVTSAARLPDGQGVGLALVHPDVPAGAEVRVLHDGVVIAARVVEINPA